MPPFSGDTIGAAQDLLIKHKAAASTGAEDYAKHRTIRRASAIHGLRQRKAISIVTKTNLSPQLDTEIITQGFAIDTLGIAVFHAASKGRFGTWATKANTRVTTGGRF